MSPNNRLINVSKRSNHDQKKNKQKTTFSLDQPMHKCTCACLRTLTVSIANGASNSDAMTLPIGDWLFFI